MQTLKQIIVINLTIFPLLSSTFIKPAGETSQSNKHAKKKVTFASDEDSEQQQQKALSYALKNVRAKKAYDNYNSIKLIPQLQKKALEDVATIISVPYLSQQEKESIATWASKTLLYYQQQLEDTNRTWQNIAVDLLRRAQDIHSEQISKCFQIYQEREQKQHATKKTKQKKIKNNIINKVKKKKQSSIGIENLTSYQFNLEEKTLLSEHFAILKLQNKDPRLTIQENEFITFNDLDELERQVHLERLTNSKKTFLKQANQQSIAHSVN